MSSITSCPSCGQKLKPSGPGGGGGACTNPACAGVSAGGATATAVLAKGAVAPRPGPRRPGAPPELLARLPQSVWVSPPVISCGFVGVVLYGLVLFAVVSTRRPAPEPEPAPRTDLLAYATVSSPLVEPQKPEPPKAAPSAPSRPEAAKKPDAAKKPNASKKKGAGTSKVAGESKDKAKSSPAGEVPKTPPPDAKPRDLEIARVSPAPTPTPSTATPTPRTGSAESSPSTSPAPAPVEPAGTSWGSLVAMPTDCAIRPDPDGLTISLPGGFAHVLSPELRLMNAPRLLTTTRGDFTAVVTVPGKRLLPGTTPLKGLPFTFQGAGLILWQDEGNYLVLERTASYSVPEGRRYHRIVFEYWHDGKKSSEYRDARDADITVKLERNGSNIRAQYTPDGRNWIDVKRMNVSLSNEIKVGVTASDASPKAYEARFEKFTLTPGRGG